MNKIFRQHEPFTEAATLRCESCKERKMHLYDEENFVCCPNCAEIYGMDEKSRSMTKYMMEDNPREPLR